MTTPLTELINKMRTHEAELERELTQVRAMLAAAEGRDTRTTELLLDVLRDDELHADWTVQDLTAAIAGRGWSTPSTDPVNAVRAALTRLTEQGKVRRVKRGVYAYAEQDFA